MDKLTWGQLSDKQKAEVVSWMDETVPYEDWEYLHGKFVIREDGVWFADERVH